MVGSGWFVAGRAEAVLVVSIQAVSGLDVQTLVVEARDEGLLEELQG